MTAFNLARWLAKEVTGPKNTDKKVFIIGPGGSGKSMTGVKLGKSVARWISFYNHNGIFAHANEYFTFDPDHIAIINTKDLLHVMTARLKKNSVKIIDDCGATKGFTNRRSMSTENLDIASIYGTNRVRNGVTIYCVQDTTFTDIRMRKLADVIIDLTDWYQYGPFRIGRLRKIRMDKTSKIGIKEVRFMTYQHGEWVTQENIACEMPDPETKIIYDDMREKKEAENSKAINEKYNKMLAKDEAENNRPTCPNCGSVQYKWIKKLNHYHCNGCGHDS